MVGYISSRTYQISIEEFKLLPNMMHYATSYIEASVRGLKNCSSSSLLGFIAELLATILLKNKPEDFEEKGLSRQKIASAIHKGLTSLEEDKLTEDQINTMATSIVLSKNVKYDNKR